MLDKFFITIFLILSFWVVLGIKVGFKKEHPDWLKFISAILGMIFQSGVGACIAMIIYNLWK